MNTAIIVAAGTGERLGSARPKAFVDLRGEPLLAHALRAFSAASSIHEQVVVVPGDEIEQAQRICDAALPGVAVALCAGGATRAESVRRGLAACGERTDVVAVHDAARPLVSASLIDRAVAALEPPWEAVAPALPVVDTLKLVDGERVVHTVDRGGLRAVQTPQVFRLTTLAVAHRDLREQEATDDLVLVEMAGGRVRLIEGERRNFKITFPDDLAVADALLGRTGEERA